MSEGRCCWSDRNSPGRSRVLPFCDVLIDGSWDNLPYQGDLLNSLLALNSLPVPLSPTLLLPASVIGRKGARISILRATFSSKQRKNQVLHDQITSLKGWKRNFSRIDDGGLRSTVTRLSSSPVEPMKGRTVQRDPVRPRPFPVTSFTALIQRFLVRQ